MKIPWFTQGQKFAVGAIIFFLMACAFFGHMKAAHGASIFDLEWTFDGPAARKPYAYIVVADVDRVCRQAGAISEGRIYGCATPYGRDCNIYLPRNAPAWLVEHEEKHCAGGRHP